MSFFQRGQGHSATHSHCRVTLLSPHEAPAVLSSSANTRPQPGPTFPASRMYLCLQKVFSWVRLGGGNKAPASPLVLPQPLSPAQPVRKVTQHRLMLIFFRETEHFNGDISGRREMNLGADSCPEGWHGLIQHLLSNILFSICCVQCGTTGRTLESNRPAPALEREASGSGF